MKSGANERNVSRAPDSDLIIDKPPERLSLAMVGLGRIADAQIQALSVLDRFRLVAGCDKNESLKYKLPAGVPFFSDVQNLPLEEFDNVVVSVPPKFHFDLATQLLRAGKNVLVEKPLVLTRSQLAQLCELAQKCQGILVTSFHAAFAKDLLWFKENFQQELYGKLGPICFFHCRFYDPYVLDGHLVPHAINLGGSWLDSGINALSVIAALLPDSRMEVENESFTRLPQFDYEGIHTTKEYSFPTQQGDRFGYGLIDTNWALGVDRKTTLLRFFESKYQIILHHTNQQVILLDPQRNRTVLADFSTTGDRLVNQYIGVFSDFAGRIRAGQDNLSLAYRLHDQLLLQE
jgi:predicted dehydrogenase